MSNEKMRTQYVLRVHCERCHKKFTNPAPSAPYTPIVGQYGRHIGKYDCIAVFGSKFGLLYCNWDCFLKHNHKARMVGKDGK